MKLLSRNPDKPKKKLESTIGKIIYGFLLFAPLLSILVTCMYVTFNKNAYESYSGNETVINNLNINYTYQTNEVNNVNDLIEGNIYKCNYKTTTNYLRCSAYKFMYRPNINDYLENCYRTDDLINSTNNWISFEGTIAKYYQNGVYSNTNVASNLNNSTVFYFVYVNSPTLSIDISTITASDYLPIENVTYNEQQATNLDNAFEYSTTKVENSTLYNWAKNTGTYDVVHNTTQLLGIENTFIPMLMAYWLLISVIYFIYDIALMLIMVVHRKIHELQESI